MMIDFDIKEMEDSMSGPYYTVPFWVKSFEDFEKWMEMISSGEIEPDGEWDK